MTIDIQPRPPGFETDSIPVCQIRRHDLVSYMSADDERLPKTISIGVKAFFKITFPKFVQTLN